MVRKRFQPEQIISKLREAEALPVAPEPAKAPSMPGCYFGAEYPNGGGTEKYRGKTRSLE